jgi:hypothetical protein
MEQQRQQAEQQQRAEEFQLQREEFALRKKQLQAEEAAHKLSAQKEAYAMRSQAAAMPPVTAAQQGAPPIGADQAGPPPEQIMTRDAQMFTDPSGGADIAMPILSGQEQEAMAQAEQQKKMRDALGMLSQQEEIKRSTEARYREKPKAERARMYDVEVPDPNRPGATIKKLVSEAEMMRGVPVPTKPQSPRAVTGMERTALSFYNRGKAAVEDIGPLEDKVAKVGLIQQGMLKYAPNPLLSKEQQSYTQKQRTFTEARLRKESGAAIPPEEFVNDARMYFAQPGDDPATIDQKRKAREQVLDGIRFSSGKAYEEYYGEPPERNLAPRGAPPQGGGPQPGTVEDGYRFKGGDPADQKNWEKV